jgi:hypothetical protein
VEEVNSFPILTQAMATVANTARQIEQTAVEIENQYNIILYQIRQWETMVANLKRLPDGLNFLDTINLWGQQIDGLLSQSAGMSFTLEAAMGQFDVLYRRAASLNPQALLAQRQTLLNSRLEASSTAIRVQAIRTNVSNLYTRLCALLNGSWTAHGNLDSQQILAQQNGLLLHSQQATQALLASAQRLEAQRHAEQVLFQQQALQFHRQSTTLAPIGDWRQGPQVDIELPPERRP